MRLLWFVILVILGRCATAHMLDPRSIDRYAEILLSPEGGRLYYVLMYGLNGTEYARQILQPNDQGIAPVDRQQTYLAYRHQQYSAGQRLEIDSQKVSLQYIGGVAGMVIGHGGMETNRAVLIYGFDYPEGMTRDVPVPFYYEDTNFARLFAWKQIRVLGLQGVQVRGHQPYEDLVPYDYTRLDLAGFLPSTRSVSLEIVVPSQRVVGATPAVSYAQSLMEMGWPAPPAVELRLFKRVLLVGVTIALLAGGALVILSRRRGGMIGSYGVMKTENDRNVY